VKIKIDKCDEIFSRIIRMRDKACVRCGKRGEDDAQGRPIIGLQCSHYIGRGCKNTRYDEKNCDALCTGCHSYWETYKTTKYRDFKIKQLGEEEYEALVRRSHKIIKWGKKEKAEKLEELKELYKIL
jgi:hypothetical protein